MPFNLAFYMPEAINVNSKYYLNVRITRLLFFDIIYQFHFCVLDNFIFFLLFYQALFLACQNIVKELSASGFGKKNLCLQKMSVYELRELEGKPRFLRHGDGKNVENKFVLWRTPENGFVYFRDGYFSFLFSACSYY